MMRWLIGCSVTRGRRGGDRGRRLLAGVMRRRGQRERDRRCATANDEHGILLCKEQGGGRQKIHKS
jgi:hypothetical protein